MVMRRIPTADARISIRDDKRWCMVLLFKEWEIKKKILLMSLFA